MKNTLNIGSDGKKSLPKETESCPAACHSDQRSTALTSIVTTQSVRLTGAVVKN